MDKEKIVSIIESLAFVASEPLSLGRLCELIPEADRAEIKDALSEMCASEDEQGRGIQLKEVAGGYQLQTITANSPWIARLLKQKPIRLSRPALETLSIIAYRQPVTRPEIEEIRGVDSGGVIHTLLEYDFIKMEGRKDVPGRPIIYGTTKKFLEFFRLKSLSELPTLKELEDMQDEMMESRGGEGTEEPVEEAGDSEGDISKEPAEPDAEEDASDSPEEPPTDRDETD